VKVNPIMPIDRLQDVTSMPPEFQLIHPRRVSWSGWFEQPDGQMAHFIGFKEATPEEKAWHRLNHPEQGLHEDDLLAYRRSQRGPVARYIARLKFWRSDV
jgi:hypothetical protein